MSLLELVHLRKTFGDLVAVDDVGFELERGEVFGLLGPNGAGKSTSMMMLAGMIEPDSGSIILDSVSLSPNDHARRAILGVVPQDLSIYPNLTARENLRFFGRLYGVPHSKLRGRIDNVLERIGLTDRAGDLTETYSGGMKRRLNFGAALLHEPQLLILDEPNVGVDPQSRAHLLDCIRDLSKEGTAILYASHYMEEVEAICNRIAIIDHGRMIACDRIDVLLSKTDSQLELKLDRIPECLADNLGGLGELQPADATRQHPCILLPNHNSQAMSDDELRDEHNLHSSLPQVLAALEKSGAKLLAVESREPNLERLFLQLTGNRLRD